MIKKVLIGLLVALILLIGGGWLFVSLNKDVIMHELQSKLEEQGIKIELGDVDIAFFQTFPFVSAQLEDVALGQTDRSSLVEAERLSCTFQMMKLIQGDIETKKIKITNGHISLIRDKNGLTNYDFKSSGGDGNMNIVLEAIELKNMAITYRDDKSDHLIRLNNTDADIVPEFNPDNTSFDISMESFGELLTIGGVNYFTKKSLNLHTHISMSGGNLNFENSELIVDKNEINFNGSVVDINNKNPQINISLNDLDGEISELHQILPQVWLAPLREYAIDGNYRLSGQISGSLATNSSPLVQLKGLVDHTTLTYTALLHPLQKLKSEFEFEYGSKSVGSIELQNLSASYEGESINGTFSLQNFSKPAVDVVINGPFQLSTIHPDIVPSILVKDEGIVSLKAFSINYKNNGVSYAGDLLLNNIKGILSGIGFLIEKGEIHADNQLMRLSPSTILVLEDKHEISGQLDVAKNNYTLDLTSDKIDLQQFFKAMSESSSLAQPVSTVTKSNMRLKMHIDAKQVVYDHIDIDHTIADLKWHKNVIDITTNMDYCGGELKSRSRYQMSNGKTSVKAETQGVDLPTLFEQWNNFGQDQIMDKHITGAGNIQCHVKFNFLSGKAWNAQSLDVIGGLTIADGALKNVPIFEQFAGYIKQQDLFNVQFNTLSNVFKIENGRFYLPEMFIQSNAANIIIAGHQTLDHRINYALKINAGQVLTNKIKKHDAKMKPVRAKKNGFFNLHYILEGPIDNFGYEVNKRRVLDKFEQSLFIRDEVLDKLGKQFDIGSRYDSPHLFQEIPEEIPEEESKVEYLNGFE